MADERRVIKSPFESVEEWGDWINAHSVPDPEPNQAVLAGSGGRPATREELLAYFAEHKARIERDAPERGGG